MRQALAAIIFLLAGVPASAQALAATAATAWREGQVQDAIAGLERGIARSASPSEAWGLSRILADICINSRDGACIRRNAKLFYETGEKSGAPRQGAQRFVFLVSLERVLSGDAKFVLDRDGADFALKYADPAADPLQAARFFLLNARVAQDSGDYVRARRHINRAFAAWLRIDAAYSRAVVLKDLIAAVFASQDTARGLKWLSAGMPLLQTLSGYDRADLVLLTADTYGAGARFEDAGKLYGEAFTAFTALQIDEQRKQAVLSGIAIAQAGSLTLQGKPQEARQAFAKSPMHAARVEILKRGVPASYAELYYIASDVFFDRLTGNAPHKGWAAVLAKTPDWKFGDEAGVNAAVYQQVALGLLADDPAQGRKLFNQAIEARLALFEKQRSDISAFPLPSMLDRVLLGIGVHVWTTGNPQEAALLVKAMELTNRNVRYAVSDALTTMVAQQTEEQRRAAHAVLRLNDRREIWEVGQIAQMVERAGKPPSKSWAAPFAARDFDHALLRMGKGMRPAESRLPSLADVQASLGTDEAFIGFVGGKKLCLRHGGVWSAAIFAQAAGEGLTPSQQLKIDLKLLLAALTDQNSPSDVRDSQFPVAASMRLYKIMFGGFDACLAGASQIQLFAPSDVAGIPVSVLLKDAPPRLGSGYDLSKAHWLVRDYAVAQVTSVRDFLSARALSGRPGGAVAFAGMGDPRLGTRLADGATGAGNIVRRSAAVGESTLRALAELPDTATEVRSIAAHVKGASTVLLGDQATEEGFRALPLAQYQVLHFATHGLVRGEIAGLAQPALVFTPKDMTDELNDGLLTASEIANLSLAARLVVLSACNTANFDPSAFNAQIQGLSSAFAVAGVPATVASLWSVETQTSARLMTNLYKHLLSGAAPGIALALQRATLDTIHSAPSRPYYHPRFWAPFVALGDGAAKVDAGAAQPARTLVAISDGGGEVLSAVGRKDAIITSEISRRPDGTNFSSIVARAPNYRVLWSQDDTDIGAGPMRAFDNDVVAAGYRSEGARSVPVLRRVTPAGKLRWQVTLKSRFDYAVISAVATSKTAIFAVMISLDHKDSGYDFEVVRLDASGVEQKRLRKTISAGGMLASGYPMTAVVRGEELFLAASKDQTGWELYRDDFGFVAPCPKDGGADFYRIGAQDLDLRQKASAAGLFVRQLTEADGRLLLAGSERIVCQAEDERPLLGELSPELSVTPLWRDDSVFSGRLVSVLPTTTGLTAVGRLHAPLNVRQPVEDDQGNVLRTAEDEVFAVKNPPVLNNRQSVTLVIELDKAGRVRSRNTLSSGLSQFPFGLVQAGAGLVVYGSAGFNPWLEMLSR